MTTTKHKATKRRIAYQPKTAPRKAHKNERSGNHVTARKLPNAVTNGKKRIGRPPLNEGRVKLTCYVLPTTLAALYAKHGQTMGRKVDALVNGF
jgi:hypothetical protein